jgi:hypothetical protein
VGAALHAQDQGIVSPTSSAIAASTPLEQSCSNQVQRPHQTHRLQGARKDLVSDVKHLPSKENLFWLGVGGGLALTAHPFDDNVNKRWSVVISPKVLQGRVKFSDSPRPC